MWGTTIDKNTNWNSFYLTIPIVVTLTCLSFSTSTKQRKKENKLKWYVSEEEGGLMKDDEKDSGIYVVVI